MHGQGKVFGMGRAPRQNERWGDGSQVQKLKESGGTRDGNPKEVFDQRKEQNNEEGQREAASGQRARRNTIGPGPLDRNESGYYSCYPF